MDTQASQTSIREPENEGVSKLHALALTGTAWNLLSYGLGQVLRLAGNIILTHLLVPEYFGLMTLLSTVILGLNLFSDLGVGANIVQNERGDDRAFLNTTWTLKWVRGIALWIVVVCLAYPAARFYHEPQLTTLLPVLGLVLVISGFESTNIESLARHLQVRQLSIFEIGIQVFQLLVMIGWAVVQASVWALVAGRLISELVRLVVSHWLLPGERNRIAWDKEAVRSLIEFGRWIFLSTALSFLASQSDRLILGRLVSLGTLGLYGIAFAFADIPRQVVLSFCGRIAYPFIAKFARLERSQFRTVALRYRGYILLVSAAILALVVNSADLALLRLYDKRYHGAAWIVPILSIGLWHTVLYSTINPCLLAVGQARFAAFGNLSSAAVVFGLAPLAFHFAGLWGAVWVVSFSDFPLYLVSLYGSWRENMFSGKQDLKFTLLFILLLAGVGLLRLWAGIPYPTVTALR